MFLLAKCNCNKIFKPVHIADEKKCMRNVKEKKMAISMLIHYITFATQRSGN